MNFHELMHTRCWWTRVLKAHRRLSSSALSVSIKRGVVQYAPGSSCATHKLTTSGAFKRQRVLYCKFAIKANLHNWRDMKRLCLWVWIWRQTGKCMLCFYCKRCCVSRKKMAYFIATLSLIGSSIERSNCFPLLVHVACSRFYFYFYKAPN